MKLWLTRKSFKSLNSEYSVERSITVEPYMAVNSASAVFLALSLS